MTQQIPRNLAKTRRAAAHPKRPGEQCAAPAGKYHPVVDFKRCEGKKDCVEVCPYGVFALGPIKAADYASLGIFGKLKSRVHGGQVAEVVHGELCQACGLCVVACPEKAITLVG